MNSRVGRIHKPRISARSIVIATGARYRKLALENLSRLEGAGVYYGAMFVEAQLCRAEEAFVVGGGNAAGQAAAFLAESTKHVYLLIRSASLADTMSRYLIRRLLYDFYRFITTLLSIVYTGGGGGSRTHSSTGFQALSRNPWVPKVPKERRVTVIVP